MDGPGFLTSLKVNNVTLCSWIYGVLLSGKRPFIMSVLELGRSSLINLTAKAVLYVVTCCGKVISVLLINNVPEAYMVYVSSIFVPLILSLCAWTACIKFLSMDNVCVALKFQV